MKLLSFIILPITLASCCLGNRKCIQDINSSRFRIVDKISGNDLVFGSTSVYDKSMIKFYSLNGIDTIYHNYGAGPNPNPGEDSLLYVNFDYRKKDTVFVKLSDADIDTLSVTYPIIDGSPCCSSYTSVKPISLNNNFVEEISGGITILKK